MKARMVVLLLLVAGGVRAAEQLTLPTPEDWRGRHGLATSLLRLSAFAIPGEDPELVDRLSVEWFSRTLARDADPFMLVEQAGDRVRGNCRGGRDQGVFAGEENGYPTVVRLLLCPRVKDSDPARGELLMTKVIEGRDGFWIVVRGRELAAGTAPTPDALRGTVAAWSRDLRAIRLCDPEEPAHPCPED